ncbi:hypothetical protein BS78_05G240500 [Paspalum vaginatum]|nr:hypothetical protein BS78_05G240500 [Paspalum vaginatum]
MVIVLLLADVVGVPSSTASASVAQNASSVVAKSTRDPAWKYATLPNKALKHQVKCNFCESIYAGGIIRIKYHLAKIPKSNVVACDNVPTNVYEEMLALLTKTNNNKEKKTKDRQNARAAVNLDHSEGEESSEEEPSNTVVVLKEGRTGSASSAKGGPMEMFCKSTVEEASAAKKGSSLSNKVQTKLSTQKREERRDRAYKRGRGVMNLVVHSAYGVCFLDSVECSSVKKDGNFIFDLVDSCIKDIGEENVVQVVTDNASSNLAAAALLKAKRPSIFWNGCAAHTIDLMLEDIGKIKQVDQTIVRARAFTAFIYSHTRVLALMRNFLGKDLVRAGVTRFATAYLNLRSLLDNKKELVRMFRSDELIEMGYLNKDKGKNASKIVRFETFWKNVDAAVNFFEPLANVLRRMDSDVPAMGFLHGCLLDAKKDIAKRFDNDERSFKDVWDIIDKRWDAKLKTPLHLAGYYLNPYYYYPNKLEIDLDGTFREGLVSCITKMIKEADIQDKIMDEPTMFQDGMGSFGKDIATRQRRKENFDPAKWWLNHGTSSPNLRKLATRILGLTCSSSACERNWSAFEQVHSKRRTRLLHDRMRDLVFVKFNSKLKQKRQNKLRDPIEKQVVDILEDDSNEWITGVAENVEQAQDQEAVGAKEQDEAVLGKRKRNRVCRPRKRRTRRIIDITEGNEDEPEAASSSDTEDDHDIDMAEDSDHSSSSMFDE